MSRSQSTLLKKLGLLVATAVMLLGVASAFQTSPGVLGSRSINHRARTVPGAHYRTPVVASAAQLKMSKAPSPGEKADADKKAVISADGTFYDDEVSVLHVMMCICVYVCVLVPDPIHAMLTVTHS